MSIRSKAPAALAVVAWLFAACIVVQIFLAGLGVFDSAQAFLTHRDFGYMFGLLTIVMVIISVVGRLGRRLIGLSLLTLGQMVLQSILVAFRADAPAVAALHPVNGVLLLVVSLWLGREAWAHRRVAAGMSEAAAPAT